MIGLGAKDLSEQAIADGFADVGAQRASHADNDRAGASLRCLSATAERDPAVALFASTLRTPTFPDEVLAREKSRAIAALKESETKPETIAERALSKAMYGAHPYGLDPTSDSIAAINRADVESFTRPTMARRARW